MSLAIKDKDGYYYAGLNVWDRQLRKAKLYNSVHYAKEIRDSARFAHRRPYIVEVRIEECGIYYCNE